MHPTIRDGATVLVERWPPPPVEERSRGNIGVEEGAIYLVQDDHGHTVKRLALVEHSLLIYSDNPPAWPKHVALEDAHVRTIILGRVRWIGQEAD